MRTLAIGISALILVVTISVAAALSRAAGPQATVAHPLVTKAEYDRWQKELSNWGRWGKDDEMGTLNLVTPAKRKQAAALVKDGISVSLASNAATEKGIDVPCPVEWAMLIANQSSAMDRIGYPCIHGAGTTHLDSFAQCFLRRENVERLSRCRRGYNGPRRRKEFHSDDEERDRYTGCSV